MDKRSASRYEAQTPVGHASTTMPSTVYIIVNSILWLGVLAIAWPLFIS